MTPDSSEITHFHLFCGLGGGALGFQQAHARVGQTEARMVCLGGVDSDPAACRDFERMTGSPATCLDLFDRDQYRDFQGHEPPSDWQEATPGDLRRAAGSGAPDILFLSPPCKGYSGLLSNKNSRSRKYQALNRLVTRGLFLALEAWGNDPPSLILLENVPRISTRGRDLLDQVHELLYSYGYAVAETTHDCGELGGLAQHRRRFLLVARHRERVPPFLYEPPQRRVRSVGEVLGDLPLPDDPAGGPMHTLPRLTRKTWVRLALIPAGRDWRALRELDIVHYQGLDGTETPGVLSRYGIVPVSWQAQTLGVLPWSQASGVITGRAQPTTGRFSVADPRPGTWGDYQAYGLRQWSDTCGAITGQAAPGTGAFSVADPRSPWMQRRNAYQNYYKVVDWGAPSQCVTGATRPASGAFSVADPRVGCLAGKKSRFASSGQAHYGVLNWEDSSKAVTASASHDNGAWSVADPRLPAPGDRPDPPPVIVSLDGTWHRPLTTAELGTLQGFPWEVLTGGLDGAAHSHWRQRIGNAVPPPSAQAIASTMAQTLLLARSGVSFQLSSSPIWVDPRVAAALSIEVPDA